MKVLLYPLWIGSPRGSAGIMGVSGEEVDLWVRDCDAPPRYRRVHIGSRDHIDFVKVIEAAL